MSSRATEPGAAGPAACATGCIAGAQRLARWRCVIGWAVYVVVAVLVIVVAGAAAAQATAAQNYATHCAACHGADRFGGTGPALLPENLERLRKPAAADTIAKGRTATQMPAFGDRLSKEELDALVAWDYAPPAVRPVWGAAEIAASRVVHHADAQAQVGRQGRGRPLRLLDALAEQHVQGLAQSLAQRALAEADDTGACPGRFRQGSTFFERRAPGAWERLEQSQGQVLEHAGHEPRARVER